MSCGPGNEAPSTSSPGLGGRCLSWVTTSAGRHIRKSEIPIPQSPLVQPVIDDGHYHVRLSAISSLIIGKTKTPSQTTCSTRYRVCRRWNAQTPCGSIRCLSAPQFTWCVVATASTRSCQAAVPRRRRRRNNNQAGLPWLGRPHSPLRRTPAMGGVDGVKKHTVRIWGGGESCDRTVRAIDHDVALFLLAAVLTWVTQVISALLFTYLAAVTHAVGPGSRSALWVLYVSVWNAP